MNTDRNDTKTADIRNTAEQLVYGLGIRADLKGAECLVDAVILYSSKTCKSFYELYETIGRPKNKQPKTVLREISYSIDQAFDIAARLSDLLGFNVSSADIHSSLVISYLGTILANPSLAKNKTITD